MFPMFETFICSQLRINCFNYDSLSGECIWCLEARFAPLRAFPLLWRDVKLAEAVAMARAETLAREARPPARPRPDPPTLPAARVNIRHALATDHPDPHHNEDIPHSASVPR